MGDFGATVGSATVELPIVYENFGIAPRHRKPDKYRVKGNAIFSIPVIEPDKLEKVASYEYHSDDEGNPYVFEVPYFNWNGRLLEELSPSGYNESNHTFESIKKLKYKRLDLVPDALRLKDTAYYYGSRSTTVYDEVALGEKHIEKYGKVEAVERLQQQLSDRIFICEGKAYTLAKDPSIGVSFKLDDERLVKIRKSRSSTLGYQFPIDSEHVAYEFASILANKYELSVVDSEPIGGGIIKFSKHADFIPKNFNPIVTSAQRFIGMAELNTSNTATFGVHVKELGHVFIENPTVSNAMDFMDAFKVGAKKVNSEPRSRLSDSDMLLLDAWDQYIDLIPHEYTYDDNDTVDLTQAAPATPTLR